jgi:hypothetical protein
MSNLIHAEASAVIDARPDEVHAVIADYQVGHPAILAKPYFTELSVEKGGQGAGTIVRGNIRVMGKDFPLHHQISEPEPGRVLVETGIETGEVTRFTFEPLNGGTQTRVTIASDFPPSPGFMGVMERLTKSRMARGMYQQELRNLAKYVSRNNVAVGAN